MLRPATDADADLQLRLLAANRAAELRLTGWTEGQRDAFFRMQLAARTRDYRLRFPAASVDIVQAFGADIGRWQIDRSGDQIIVVDIALLPDHCGRGIGSAMLRALLDEASASARHVALQVARDSAARRLYLRLGFVETERQGLHVAMRRLAPTWRDVAGQA
jgi:GNAT superfamily N-acetyltransferase